MEQPPPPSPGRRTPWAALAALVVVAAAIWATVLAGRRAAVLDGLVSQFNSGRDRYVVGVCHDDPQLATVPGWARPLQDRCLVDEPKWGTEAPSRDALAQAALPDSGAGGFVATVGHLFRTFNPIVLLEIFVAFTVGFFVLLGVRGGETPAETVLSRLGSGVRQRFVKTANRAAFVGLVVGSASLVAGTWASELQDERRICHQTAVSYGFLAGIDRRCDSLMNSVRRSRDEKTKAVVDEEACQVARARTEARLNANATIEKTAADLATTLTSDTDQRTKVVVDALRTSFSALAEEVQSLRADTKAWHDEAAKETSVAAAREGLDKVQTSLADQRATDDRLEREVAKASSLDALEKSVAKEETLAALAAAEHERADALQAKLAPLRRLDSLQCVAPAELSTIEKALEDIEAAPALHVAAAKASKP